MANQMGAKSDEGPMYIVYDREDDKILGPYSKYDDAGRRVCCTPDEVMYASLVLPDKLMEERFLVLEVKEYEGQELLHAEVDVDDRELVARQSKFYR